jgi:uncharacterized protein YhdP
VDKSGDKPSQEEARHTPEQTAKRKWPPVALQMTAQVQVDAEEGQYRSMKFHNLKMDATYDRGVVRQCDLSFGMEGGQVAMTGSGDIRDPEHVTFAVSPKMTSMKLETMAALLGVPEVSVSGPISLSGRLQGKTGSSDDLLASLDGNLNARIGPGKLARIGRGGEFMARMLSLTSLRGILTGSVFQDFASKGLPYQAISAQATLQDGNMDLSNFLFESNAMNIGAQGRIDLLEAQMDINTSLKPLGAVSTVMGFVPLVGKVAAGLTEIHFNLSGSLDDPRVSIIPGQGIADSVQNQARGVGSMFKGFTGFFDKVDKQETRK